MKRQYLWTIAAILILMPEFVYGQDAANVPPSAAPSSTSVAQPGAGAASAPRPRRRRTILNREFDDREKIALLLNAHCDFPSKEDLLSTSPEAEKHLQDIYADESVLLSVRMRAVQALSYFETPQNRETIEKILAHPESAEHLLILIQAIRAYAVMAPNEAPRVIEPYLSHRSDFVRLIAINTLKNCPGQAALDVLNARYHAERNRFFQTRIKQAIDGHCKGDSYCQ